jgi:hypothetical protein
MPVIEISEASLHTAFNRDGKWYVRQGDNDVELSPEMVAKRDQIVEERRNRDRELTAAAQRAVKDVLHYAFVSKDESGNSTAIQQLGRGIVKQMFKDELKASKLVIKGLDENSKTVNNVCKLIIDKLASNAEDLGASIGASITEALQACQTGFVPGVKLPLDYTTVDVVKNYVGFAPSASLKDSDMARATAK